MMNMQTQNKDIMIHTKMTKMIITIAMMLEKRLHFKKKNSTNCETSSAIMWYSSWFSCFLIVIFIFMIQSVCIITNFPVKVTSCFWWFYDGIFRASMQICVMLKYKFVYSATLVSPYFFLLVILVCTFTQLLFIPDQAFVFVSHVLDQ